MLARRDRKRHRRLADRADARRDRLREVGRHLVGAAIFVLVAVVGLRLQRALIAAVLDAVVVVIRIGAAVLVLEAVEVLGLVGALVGGTDDAVAVGIELRAAV